MRLSLLLLTLFVGANALIEFTLPVRFSDGQGPRMPLVVDTMFGSSFVLGREEFGDKAGAGKTYDPDASKNAKHLDSWKAHTYPNGESYGTVTGHIYQDLVAHYPELVAATFLVAKISQGDYNPVKDINGTYVAGHLGISREKGPTNLAERILNQTENKVWCGEAVRVGRRYIQRSIQGILPQGDRIVTKIPTDKRTHYWKLTAINVTTGGATLAPAAKTVISSVIDKILFPERYLGKAVRLFKATKVGGKYKVDCYGNYDIDFVAYGTKDVRIATADLLEKTDEGCFLKIGQAWEDDFIFGLPFFANRGICFDFDLEEIVLYKPTPY